MSYRTDAIDREVLSLLPTERHEAIAIVDLVRNSRFKLGTVRNTLKRLLEQGAIDGIWDGNERYGRLLYFAK
jgi:DNA-binding Lrp family transcriptional regulator